MRKRNPVRETDRRLAKFPENRGDAMMFPMKILLTTDGSAEAGRAAQMAVEPSERLDSELHLFHVTPVPSAYAVPESVTYKPEFYERLRDTARRKARRRRVCAAMSPRR